MQQILVNQWLINFMSDWSDNWAGEYPRGYDSPAELSTQWSQNTKVQMLNKLNFSMLYNSLTYWIPYIGHFWCCFASLWAYWYNFYFALCRFYLTIQRLQIFCLLFRPEYILLYWLIVTYSLRNSIVFFLFKPNI